MQQGKHARDVVRVKDSGGWSVRRDALVSGSTGTESRRVPVRDLNPVPMATWSEYGAR